jgi:hypothetical protein
MGRSGSNANQAQSTQDAAISKDQVARANKATDAFNADLGKMKGNPNLYANPYKDPEYLRNQNLITSAASSATNSAAANQLNSEALRTGSNTASREASIRDLARQKSRAMVDYQAGRNAQDRNSYLDWERFLLGANLAPANVNTDMFRTSTSGQNNANTNLANIQNSQQAMWGSIIGGAASGLGAAFTGKA